MKVNPIGIQSYQQLANRQQQTEKSSADLLEKTTNQPVSIPAQDETSESKVAVKVTAGNYSDFLTTEERDALELLFNRFNDSSRFGSGYQTDIKAEAKEKSLGTFVDVKV